jgi:hypothetical protein
VREKSLLLDGVQLVCVRGPSQENSEERANVGDLAVGRMNARLPFQAWGQSPRGCLISNEMGRSYIS